MGILSGIFGKGANQDADSNNEISWISLVSMDQIEEIEAKSITKTQVIFKHSTRCGISRMVLNTFKNGYNLEDGVMDIYYLDLFANRDVSNAISQKFGVVHQSPQLLIIKNGTVVAHDSHGGINEINLESHM